MKQQYYAVCSLEVADGICPLRVPKYVRVPETIHFLTPSALPVVQKVG